MKVLIIPDSFKGSLTSMEVCQVVEAAFLNVNPNLLVHKLPMADGGEGTVEALVINTNGRFILCEVQDPLGRLKQATYGILGDGKTAVIEMAEASGLPLLKIDERNPMKTSSYGTGQLILDALNNNCSRIIIGLGGSSTNEGGIGMLQALGVEFYGNNNNVLMGIGQNLINIRKIDITNLDDRLKNVRIDVACDVKNTLTGINGATFVYSHQKGATIEMQNHLESGMENYAKLLEELSGLEIDNIPGTGAAGGMGAGLMGILGARMTPGFELISNILQVEELIKNEKFDLIITGEGQINHQTIFGKLPYGIARLGKKYQIPVIALAGSIEKGYDNLYEEGLTSALSIVTGPMDLSYAMEHAEQLLYDSAFRLMKMLSR
jgi:glycerate 2-kinase